MTFRQSDNGLNSSYKVDILLCPILIRSARLCFHSNGVVSYVSTTLESCGERAFRFNVLRNRQMIQHIVTDLE